LNFYITENTVPIHYKDYPINSVLGYIMSSIYNQTKHVNTLCKKLQLFNVTSVSAYNKAMYYERKNGAHSRNFVAI